MAGSKKEEVVSEKPKAQKAKAAKVEEAKVETKIEEKKAAPAKAKKKEKVALPPKEELKEVENKVQEEIESLAENFNFNEIADAISSLDFFVDQRSDDCAEKGCENLRTTQQYCRLHYIANWYDIKRKREILAEGKLQEYIEELISKYPTQYIESLLGDLQDDKDFYKALHELNITSELEFEDDIEGIEGGDDDDDDIEVETRVFTSKSRIDDD